MNRSESPAISIFLFAAFAVVIIFGVIGWITNISILLDAEGMSKGQIVLRAIGLFVMPLGAVLGYFPA